MKPSDSKHDLDIKLSEKWNLEGLKSVVSKDAHKKSEGGGQWGPIKKSRVLHLGNVEKPPHSQFSAQRAPEG